MSESMAAMLTGVTLISTGVALIATCVAIAAARSSMTNARKLRTAAVPPSKRHRAVALKPTAPAPVRRREQVAS